MEVDKQRFEVVVIVSGDRFVQVIGRMNSGDESQEKSEQGGG